MDGKDSSIELFFSDLKQGSPSPPKSGGISILDSLAAIDYYAPTSSQRMVAAETALRSRTDKNVNNNNKQHHHGRRRPANSPLIHTMWVLARKRNLCITHRNSISMPVMDIIIELVDAGLTELIQALPAYCPDGVPKTLNFANEPTPLAVGDSPSASSSSSPKFDAIAQSLF